MQRAESLEWQAGMRVDSNFENFQVASRKPGMADRHEGEQGHGPHPQHLALQACPACSNEGEHNSSVQGPTLSILLFSSVPSFPLSSLWCVSTNTSHAPKLTAYMAAGNVSMQACGWLCVCACVRAHGYV